MMVAVVVGVEPRRRWSVLLLLLLLLASESAEADELLQRGAGRCTTGCYVRRSALAVSVGRVGQR